jgi:hypothetical protein
MWLPKTLQQILSVSLPSWLQYRHDRSRRKALPSTVATRTPAHPIGLASVPARTCTIQVRQPNQVYCQVMPTVVKLVPIRAVTPSDQFSFSEWPLARGRESVSPTLVFSRRSAFWTPLTVVRPPAYQVASAASHKPG